MHKPVTDSSAPRQRTARRRAAVCALCLAALALICPLGPSTGAASNADYVVVVNVKNPATFITRATLSALFLKRTARWPDGEAVRPADLHSESSVRNAFSENVLQRSVVAVRRYWQQRIFSGRELPPPELNSEQDMVLFVEQTRGAVGYVSSKAKLTNVKVLPIRDE